MAETMSEAATVEINEGVFCKEHLREVVRIIPLCCMPLHVLTRVNCIYSVAIASSMDVRRMMLIMGGSAYQ